MLFLPGGLDPGNVVAAVTQGYGLWSSIMEPNVTFFLKGPKISWQRPWMKVTWPHDGINLSHLKISAVSHTNIKM